MVSLSIEDLSELSGESPFSRGPLWSDLEVRSIGKFNQALFGYLFNFKEDLVSKNA